MKLKSEFYILFIIILFVSTVLLDGQPSKNISIQISDLIKGINDKDYLRAYLIENGFRFTSKENLRGNQIELETWDFHNQHKESVLIVRLSIIHNYLDQNTVQIDVNTRYFPEYAVKLLNDVKKSFPLKKTLESERLDIGKYYFLKYYRNIDNIIIKFSVIDDWHIFTILQDNK